MLFIAKIPNSSTIIKQTLRCTVFPNLDSCYSRLYHAKKKEKNLIVSQQEIEEGHYKTEDLPIALRGITDSRILYSSHIKECGATLDPLKLHRIGKAIQEREQERRKRLAVPLIIEQNVVQMEEYEEVESSDTETKDATFFYPYSHTQTIDIPESYSEPDPEPELEFTEQQVFRRVDIEEEIAARMKAYDEGVLEELDKPKGNIARGDDEQNDLMELLGEGDGDLSMMQDHGTADPNIPVSNVPCGGCGAFLHCQQPSLMGFIPKELFIGRNSGELRNVFCQRCYFLRIHKMALNVRVDPEMYGKLLEPIKRKKKVLVMLVLDLLDMPCSIWPRIMNIIGSHIPVVVLGNKVDLLPADGRNHLRRVKDSFITAIEKTPLGKASIQHITLVSAHTGFGIENLITKIQKFWGTKGDIYIVGCTNSGKSTLFNALLGSDLCKTSASSLIQRATVSPWPGTTLNMLKFPILRPSGHMLYLRTKRLIEERKKMAKRPEKLFTKSIVIGTLSGHIGRTLEKDERMVQKDPFSTDMSKMPVDVKPILGINPNKEQYALSKWCYDTPGTIQPEQMINLLTHEELMAVLPRHLLRPETFCLHSGHSLLLAGLARLDLVYSPSSVRFTVFRSSLLPLTITKTSDAATVYRQYLGSPLMGVPLGGDERLKSWPALHPVNLRVMGHTTQQSCVDVVLSSAGWVSLTSMKMDQVIDLRAWTPGGRGIHLRDPPLLPRAVTLRGKRIGKSLAHRPHRIFVPGVNT